MTSEDKNNIRVRAVFRYDRRLPDVSGIMRKNGKTMVSDDIRLIKVFPNHQWYALLGGRI